MEITLPKFQYGLPDKAEVDSEVDHWNLWGTTRGYKCDKCVVNNIHESNMCSSES